MTWLVRLAEALVIVMCAGAGGSAAYGLALLLGHEEPIYSIIGVVAGVMLGVRVVRWGRGDRP